VDNFQLAQSAVSNYWWISKFNHGTEWSSCFSCCS